MMGWVELGLKNGPTWPNFTQLCDAIAVDAGYGHIAPKTTLGRIITMIYALLGIPLTFLYLSNIGNFMANTFRLFYKRVCCDIFCCQKCDRDRQKTRSDAVMHN